MLYEMCLHYSFLNNLLGATTSTEVTDNYIQCIFYDGR